MEETLEIPVKAGWKDGTKVGGASAGWAAVGDGRLGSERLAAAGQPGAWTGRARQRLELSRGRRLAAAPARLAHRHRRCRASPGWPNPASNLPPLPGPARPLPPQITFTGKGDELPGRPPQDIVFVVRGAGPVVWRRDALGGAPRLCHGPFPTQLLRPTTPRPPCPVRSAVQVRQKPHPTFTREGDDLVAKLRIPLR